MFPVSKWPTVCGWQIPPDTTAQSRYAGTILSMLLSAFCFENYRFNDNLSLRQFGKTFITNIYVSKCDHCYVTTMSLTIEMDNILQWLLFIDYQDWIIALDHTQVIVKPSPCKGWWLIGIAPDPGTRKGLGFKPSGAQVNVVLVLLCQWAWLGGAKCLWGPVCCCASPKKKTCWPYEML